MANVQVVVGKTATDKVHWFNAAGVADDVAVTADSFSGDNDAVATVAADPADPTQAIITGVSAGTVNVACRGTNADGVTVDAAPVAVDVVDAPLGDATSGTQIVTPIP